MSKPIEEMSTNEQGCLAILFIIGGSLAFGLLATLTIKVLTYLDKINVL